MLPKPDLPSSPSLMTSMPALTCLRTTSTIPLRTCERNSCRSTVRPVMMSLDICIRLGGPSSRPACVVRMRSVLRFMGTNILDSSCNQGKGNFEIGRILHLKSEIRNLELDRQSNLIFRISDLRCRIRPISKFPLFLVFQECSSLKLIERLAKFPLSVHHDRAVPGHGFFQRLARNQQEPDAILPSMDDDLVAALENDKRPGAGRPRRRT